MIDPTALFSEKILNFSVHTSRHGARSYINLDSAATTPPLRIVENRVKSFLETYGSVHRGAGTKSTLSTDIFEHSRRSIGKFIGADSNTYILFTNNTTVGMNTLAHYFSQIQGKIAVSKIEHSSSWLPWIVAEGHRSAGNQQRKISELATYNSLVQESGRKQVMRYGLNDQSEFDLAAIEVILRENQIKALVLTASSNLTGYVPEIKSITSLARNYGAYVVVDGCQFIQHHPVNMKEMGIDFLVASGHKFYAPYGGGFIAGPKDFFDLFLPYQIGGGNLPYIDIAENFYTYSSERAHDPGTPNAVGAISMAAALEELEIIGISNIETYERTLALRALNGLAKNPRVKVLADETRLTTVLPFIIQGINHNEVAARLNDEYGIGVRAGSFCVFDSIRALLGIENDRDIVTELQSGKFPEIPGIIRASFSIANTHDDVDAFVAAITEIAEDGWTSASQEVTKTKTPDTLSRSYNYREGNQDGVCRSRGLIT